MKNNTDIQPFTFRTGSNEIQEEEIKEQSDDQPLLLAVHAKTLRIDPYAPLDFTQASLKPPGSSRQSTSGQKSNGLMSYGESDSS